MALSRMRRKEIMDSLVMEIGKNLFYGGFSVEAFADAHGLSKQSIYRYLEV